MKNSGSRQIAERYVKALSGVVQDAQAQAAVEKDFILLADAFSKSDTLEKMAANPLLTRAQQQSAIDAVLAGMKAHAVTRQFGALLARQKRLGIFPEAIALYLELCARQRGEETAELVSAAPLSPQDIAMIAERLGKAYGKKINVKARADSTLLGGLIIKIGSKQLDGSIAGKLQRLGQKLRVA